MGSSPSAPASPAAVPDTLTVHLGAHKTATTHLQHSLGRARADLRRHGVAYFGPDLLRGRLRLPQLAAAKPAQPDALRAALARNRARRCVLSDENILGTTRADRVARGAQLYPDAGARVARLLASLGVQRALLCLGVRAPLAFIASAHGQQVNAGRFAPISAYCAGFDPDALRWSELAARLLAVPGVAGLVAWRFEDYPAVAPAVLDAMLGPGAPVALLDGARLVGTSARAIAHARAQLAAAPDTDPRAAIRDARARYPKSGAHPAPRPFDDARLRADAERYAEDCARLAALEGVTLLRPGAATAADAVKPA